MFSTSISIPLIIKFDWNDRWPELYMYKIIVTFLDELLLIICY